MTVFVPRDEADLVELVGMALANETPLEICGSSSRAGLGRAVGEMDRVDMTGLSGVIEYEPSELVISVRAGTPMDTAQALLAANNQELAFEPMNHGPIYGLCSPGTMGGMVAVNASGPRRIKVGACRDHMLGFRAVTGRAEAIQSGGKVMKNVTGYDLSKLMTGSFGTLGILTEITCKVLPKPEDEITVLIHGLYGAAACDAMTRATGLHVDVSGAAHLPDGMGAAGAGALTAFRLEGAANSLVSRADALLAALGAGKGVEHLPETSSAAFWANIRDVRSLADSDAQIWRISTAPTQGAELVAAIRVAGIPVCGHFFDWAGGLVWLAVAAADDAHAGVIRDVLAPFGGHATLVRASDPVRRSVPVFQPQIPALSDLSARVRRQFDLKLILNRGRMRADL